MATDKDGYLTFQKPLEGIADELKGVGEDLQHLAYCVDMAGNSELAVKLNRFAGKIEGPASTINHAVFTMWRELREYMEELRTEQEYVDTLADGVKERSSVEGRNRT